MALIENIQREDLNPLEEAQRPQAADRGIRADARGCRAGDRPLAQRGEQSAAPPQLAQPVQEQLLAGKIDMGHARALLALPAAQQAAAAARIVAQGLSVRDAERLAHVQTGHGARRRKAARGKTGDADLRRLEEELADALGAKVRIEPSRGGAGRVVIGYSSLEQLDGLIARMKRPR